MYYIWSTWRAVRRDDATRLMDQRTNQTDTHRTFNDGDIIDPKGQTPPAGQADVAVAR